MEHLDLPNTEIFPSKDVASALPPGSMTIEIETFYILYCIYILGLVAEGVEKVQLGVWEGTFSLEGTGVRQIPGTMLLYCLLTFYDLYL
jgi:hypothetical protein